MAILDPTKDSVLVIHGMGTHEEGANKKEVNDALNEAAKGFGLKNFDFEKQVNLIEFNYSDFLDELRNKDGTHGDTLTEHITFLQGYGLGVKLVSKLIKALSDFDEDEMIYTHWLDVLYYGETLYGEKIRVDLALKLIDLLQASNVNGRKVHVIAHSLGTAILHDTLAELYDPDEPMKGKVPELPTSLLALDSIFQIANVSRLVHLLSEVDDPNRSIVNSDGKGACQLLFSVRNQYDPFTWFKTYKRPIVNGGLMKHETVRVVNTHDLKEYVLSPSVARAILGSICLKRISKTAFSAYEKEHAKNSITNKFEELKASFDELKLTAFELEDATFTDKVKALKLFFYVMKEFTALADTIIDTE